MTPTTVDLMVTLELRARDLMAQVEADSCEANRDALRTVLDDMVLMMELDAAEAK